MRAPLIRLIWIVIFSFLTIIGVGWGTRYDWPDFVHVDYGFPSKWGTHILVTFTGPADYWTVDTTTLIIDIVFWQTILIMGMLIIELKFSQK